MMLNDLCVGSEGFNEELSQILIQEDPQLIQDIINLLPQDNEEEKERFIEMVNKVLSNNEESEVN